METPLPSTPPPFCRSPKSKLICLSLGLLGLLLVAILSFSLGRASAKPPYQPVPESTSNEAGWKKYRNLAYDYQLRYPSDWKIIEYDNFLQLSGETNARTLTLIVRAEENPEKYSPIQWLEKQCPVDPLCNREELKSEFKQINSRIANTEAVKIFHTRIPDPYAVILFTRGSSAYEITTWGEEESPIYDQILSSFEFLEQTPGQENTDWKDYLNEKYHYSLRYPPSLTVLENDSSELTVRFSNKEITILEVWVTNNPDSWINNNGPKNIKVGKTIPGHQEIPLKVRYRQDPAVTNTFLEKDNNFFSFQCVHDFQKDREETCNQILSTFRFD